MLFLFGSILVLNTLAYFVPKKMTWPQLYLTTFFSFCLQQLADLILNIKYDLYGFFQKGVDWASFLPIFGLFPAVSILFLNLFPYNAGIGRKTLYLLGWSAFSISYEACALKAGWFYYNGWKLSYSALIHPWLFLLLLWHFRIVQRIS
ncbi:CBO0543 family protein [Paenibacillus hamazuiensis]|uniref:CBO0543 family protein n=1 Tax=Paenibacillus hamazuiensis TaxID=2936508 RepID=UPI00200EC683|nr:CBO0543 family protein [Paenibacillus hamazuiensis]